MVYGDLNLSSVIPRLPKFEDPISKKKGTTGEINLTFLVTSLLKVFADS